MRTELACLILLFFLVPNCQSDFNVILPEQCSQPGLNLTWIQGMVQLGIRDEQAHHKLNIWGQNEICDGSNGLLRFISAAQSDPNSRLVASLQQPLCPAAAAFSRLSKKQFISWTCPQGPGVQSMKPGMGEAIVAIQRMLNYTGWSNVAFTKSGQDRSPYCDELGAYLVQETRNYSANVSVMILGNYEDLQRQYQTFPFPTNLDGLLLCLSYEYGVSRNFTLKLTNFLPNVDTMLLPQWPLPIEVFSPTAPTLAVAATTHPRPQSSSSYDFYQKFPSDPSVEKAGPHKLLETLLAQMVLRAVKLSLDLDREHPSRHYGDYHDHGHYTFRQPEHQVVFALLQFEKARWHPLINLVNGEKHSSFKGPQGIHRRSSILKAVASGVGHEGPNSRESGESDQSIREDYLMTWFQLILAMATIVLLAMGVTLAALYARRKARKREFSTAKHCRKLSRRHRVPGGGGCKLLLTSDDLSFGSAPPEPNKKGSKSPFIGNLTFQRSSSQEKPDLLKGSFSISTVRKQTSVNNMKGDNLNLNGDSTARYKGDVVHLKKLAVPLSSSEFEVKPKAMLVLESIHGLRHENLVTLVGCFLSKDSPFGPSLVWEYCSRGSLHDIIKQSDIKLDWAFKLSLLTDLVRGMRYIHNSPVRLHGFLTSTACVIDSRWVLKIMDYGFPAFYYTEGIPLPPKTPKELLWTAPELLRDDSLRIQGTQAGDVYSFAIIMQEILVRGEPYCMLKLSTEEILEKLRKPPPLIRPSVSKGCGAPPEAINIMRQCWAEYPDMRPDFMVIHDLFKTLNHGRKANIVDTMFQMLEKYSNNLEELIRDRTEQLDLEKKKTEQLLNRMLPNTVAEKLKLGLPVDPEEFSEVTIYFSDIVGFTTISAYSTPFEVVDLLNDLYTCFDATINDYNVYKVETIGDGYMVVGGAPLWSPDHADQIAMMALDLLHQSGRFKIRHLPYTHLKLRIGLHTGSCCAGVVGLTMPRYCLFGDTVNTASRMESTGAPWRIHVSGETKAKLDEAGGYILQPRGMTDIKGKGPMPTYWLLGKEGFAKELPTPPPLTECHRLDEDDIKYGRTGVWPQKKTDPPPTHNPVVPAALAAAASTATSPSISISMETKPARESRVDSGQMRLGRVNSCRAGSTSPHHLAPPKSPSSFAVGQGGETLRSLSPAEQIAHQLLNGRPTTKGLRRQLSLDHRAMPMLLQKAQDSSPKLSSLLRRAPSLEENLESPSALQGPPKSPNKSSTFTSLSSTISTTSTVVNAPVICVSNMALQNPPPLSTDPYPIPLKEDKEEDDNTLSDAYSSSLPNPGTNFFVSNETLTFKNSMNMNLANAKHVSVNDQKSSSFVVEVDSIEKKSGLSSTVTVKDLEGSGSGSGGKGVRIGGNRVNAKLAKILSVVEEGNDSPTMDRKYEIVTNQV